LTGHFDPDKFEDRYEDALKELLKRKQEGKPIERPERPKPTNVVNLMDAFGGALRQAERPPHPSRKIMRQLGAPLRAKRSSRSGGRRARTG
jgi:DNA end-binding protein Ku